MKIRVWMIKRKQIFTASIAIITIGCAVLFWGDPQWNSIIYRFQAYIYPTSESGMIPIPKDFTGTWRGWWPNGNLMFKFECHKGFKNGKTICFHKDGIAEEIVGYWKGGMPDGLWVTYYPDGSLMSQSQYQNGVENGQSKVFWRNGNPATISFVKNGKLHGYLIGFHEDGSLREKTLYEMGEEISSEEWEEGQKQRDPLKHPRSGTPF